MRGPSEKCFSDIGSRSKYYYFTGRNVESKALKFLRWTTIKVWQSLDFCLISIPTELYWLYINKFAIPDTFKTSTCPRPQVIAHGNVTRQCPRVHVHKSRAQHFATGLTKLELNEFNHIYRTVILP